jgi:hypothetical protein
MGTLLDAFAGILVFGGLSIWMLFRAHDIQRIAIRRQDSSWTGRINPFGGFVRGASFVSMLRLLGALCAMAAMLFLRIAYQMVRHVDR